MRRLVDGLKTFLVASAILWPAILWSGGLAVDGAEPAAEGPNAEQSSVDELLATIARVGPGATGSSEARAARDALARRGLEILPQLLAAMDTRNVPAANWVRTVFDEIVHREGEQSATARHGEFLKAYAADARRAGRSRRLALAVVERTEPGFSVAWIAERLGDPEFGYEAAAHALAAGEKATREKNPAAAKEEFRKAFEHARDGAQVAQAAAKLKALGITVDPVKHLGLVVDWRIAGPFDAPAKTGFAAVFPPEQTLDGDGRPDLSASYAGKDGKSISWIRQTAQDALGQLNLNDALGTTREAVAYAYAEIEVPRAGQYQLRCGADDNCTVWLNGERVFGREQWLNGTRFDRFSAPIALAAGRNRLLVKICQGPQHRDPEVPNNWSLQLRLCDEQGRGIAFENRTPPLDDPPGR